MTAMSIAMLKKVFYVGSMKKTNSGREENIAMRKAITLFGGTVRLAKNLNTEDGNVSKWLYKQRKVPIKHALKIERLTKGQIKARDLRPDVYED